MNITDFLYFLWDGLFVLYYFENVKFKYFLVGERNVEIIIDR